MPTIYDPNGQVIAADDEVESDYTGLYLADLARAQDVAEQRGSWVVFEDNAERYVVRPDGTFDLEGA
jgi:hypothetical protein